MTFNILRKTSFFLLLSLLLVACSTKELSSPTPMKILNTSLNESNLGDEFDDEFKTADQEVFDPLENYNRWMTSSNDTFYTYLFNPVSKAYAFVTPQPARIGLSNAFHNLKFPLRFSNNLLQLKFDSSMKELGRFMINSTLGVLGLFDVAKMGGIEPQEEDFGQTLGFYGVGPGFHIVLPFLGPSNLRDSFGLGFETAISATSSGSLPYQIPDNLEKASALSGLYYLNKNSLHLGKYENFKKDALDVYTFFRDSYEQKRIKDIEN